MAIKVEKIKIKSPIHLYTSETPPKHLLQDASKMPFISFWFHFFLQNKIKPK